MQTEITFSQAINVSINKRKSDQIKFDYLIDEIENSNPECLGASDFYYYASELSEHDPSGKIWTANEIRHIMRENNDLSPYDMIETFDFETDDIIDFF